MLQSSSPSTITTARRSTRVSRIYTNSSTQAAPKSRRKGKRREFNKASTRRWAQVLRPPQSGINFKTLTWLPLERLTTEEREKYDENERVKADKKRKEREHRKETILVSDKSEVDANESVQDNNKICKNLVSSTVKGDANYCATKSDEDGDQSQIQYKNNAKNQNFMEEEGANMMTTEVSPKRSKHDAGQLVFQNDSTVKCELETNSNVNNDIEGGNIASNHTEGILTELPEDTVKNECLELKQKPDS